MKKLLLFIPVFMFFTACDGLLEGLSDPETDKEENIDEEKPGDSSDEEGGDGSEEAYLVKSVRLTDEEGMSVLFTYEYDFIDIFGKYMPVSENLSADGEDEGTVIWEYASGSVNRIFTYEGQEQYRWIYQLDSENRVNGSIEEIDVQDGQSDMNCEVKYDSEGYLISESAKEENSEYRVDYVWNDGNLVTVNSYQHIEGEDLNDDGIYNEDDIIDRTETYHYNYTDYPNNANLDLNDYLCYSYDSGLLSDGPARLGIAGKRSGNLGYGSFYEVSEPWQDFYCDRVTEGQTDKVTNYDIEIGNDQAEAVFEFNDAGLPVKITITAPKYRTEIITSYTYEIDYDGRTEVIDGTVYYFDFVRNATEKRGETYPDGQVSRVYEISYMSL